MKRNVKMFAVVGLSILAGLVLKSDRGHGQGQGSESPIIIRRIGLENQTISPGPVTLFTPTSNGLYRVSGYGDMTLQSTGEICPQLSWTDEYAFQNQYLFTEGCVFPGEGSGGSLIIHGVANQPVTLSISVEPGFRGVYSFFVTVEQL